MSSPEVEEANEQAAILSGQFGPEAAKAIMACRQDEAGPFSAEANARLRMFAAMRLAIFALRDEELRSQIGDFTDCWQQTFSRDKRRVDPRAPVLSLPERLGISLRQLWRLGQEPRKLRDYFSDSLLHEATSVQTAMCAAAGLDALLTIYPEIPLHWERLFSSLIRIYSRGAFSLSAMRPVHDLVSLPARLRSAKKNSVYCYYGLPEPALVDRVFDSTLLFEVGLGGVRVLGRTVLFFIKGAAAEVYVPNDQTYDFRFRADSPEDLVSLFCNDFYGGFGIHDHHRIGGFPSWLPQRETQGISFW